MGICTTNQKSSINMQLKQKNHIFHHDNHDHSYLQSDKIIQKETNKEETQKQMLENNHLNSQKSLIETPVNIEAEIIDVDGNIIGKFDTNGILRDAKGIKEAIYETNGIVRDAYGNKHAQIETSGVVRNAIGIKQGEVEENGTVRNANGIRIGKIEPSGTIKNANGIKIGKSKGNTRAVAHVTFFTGSPIKKHRKSTESPNKRARKSTEANTNFNTSNKTIGSPSKLNRKSTGETSWYVKWSLEREIEEDEEEEKIKL